MRKGEKPGQWRVLVEGREIGTVTKRHYPKSAGVPAFDRWRADRKGSMLDALSDRTYRTRAQAVEALMQDYGL